MVDPNSDVDKIIKVIEIGAQMIKESLHRTFIAHSIRLSMDNIKMYRLVKRWATELDREQQSKIIKSIENLIEKEVRLESRPAFIEIDNLEDIGRNIRKFKNGLRQLVEKQGGINKVSKKLNISQSSLSRFFSSNSLPRRATLLKLGKVLKVARVKISY